MKTPITITLALGGATCFGFKSLHFCIHFVLISSCLLHKQRGFSLGVLQSQTLTLLSACDPLHDFLPLNSSVYTFCKAGRTLGESFCEVVLTCMNACHIKNGTAKIKHHKSRISSRHVESVSFLPQLIPKDSNHNRTNHDVKTQHHKISEPLNK